MYIPLKAERSCIVFAVDEPDHAIHDWVANGTRRTHKLRRTVTKHEAAAAARAFQPTEPSL